MVPRGCADGARECGEDEAGARVQDCAVFTDFDTKMHKMLRGLSHYLWSILLPLVVQLFQLFGSPRPRFVQEGCSYDAAAFKFV